MGKRRITAKWNVRVSCILGCNKQHWHQIHLQHSRQCWILFPRRGRFFLFHYITLRYRCPNVHKREYPKGTDYAMNRVLHQIYQCSLSFVLHCTKPACSLAETPLLGRKFRSLFLSNQSMAAVERTFADVRSNWAMRACVQDYSQPFDINLYSPLVLGGPSRLG